MGNTSEKRKVILSAEKTLSDTIKIGFKNSASITGCIILWLLTIWIPWINVGTTIAIMTLPIELSRGNVISPLVIFDSKYRRRFGEVFVLVGMMSIALFFAFIWMIIPGIILSISWMLAIYFVLDDGTNPAEALSRSNRATEGSKLPIFIAKLVILIAGGGVLGIFLVLGFILITGYSIFAAALGVILIVASIIIYISLTIACDASIYRQLRDN